MPDLEKVIKGLELCKYIPKPGQEEKWDHSCLNCPYCWEDETDMFAGRGCWKLCNDALTILKEQQKLIDDIMQRRANNGEFD